MSARPSDAHRKEAGFTLVEVLVSLAIFSLAVVGLNRAATLAVSSTAGVSARIHAGFAADNAVVLLKASPLEVGTARSQARSGAYTFDIQTTTTATELPGFFELAIAVRREDAEQVVASRRAFRFQNPTGANADTAPGDAPEPAQ